MTECLADILINLSSGWLGLIFITPILSGGIMSVLTNLSCAILFYGLGVYVRKKYANR